METGVIITVVAVNLLILLISIAAIYWVLKKRNEDLISSAERTAQEIRNKADVEADNIRKTAELEANERINQKTRQFEKDNQRRHSEVERIENRLKNKERTLDNKIEQYERRERQIGEKEIRDGAKRAGQGTGAGEPATI